jgi:hypothetical protein
MGRRGRKPDMKFDKPKERNYLLMYDIHCQIIEKAKELGLYEYLCQVIKVERLMKKSDREVVDSINDYFHLALGCKCCEADLKSWLTEDSYPEIKEAYFFDKILGLQRLYDYAFSAASKATAKEGNFILSLIENFKKLDTNNLDKVVEDDKSKDKNVSSDNSSDSSVSISKQTADTVNRIFVESQRFSG